MDRTSAPADGLTPIVEDLDSLDSQRFWAAAEAGKRWFNSLSDEERARHLADDAEVDALFRGV